MMVMVVRCAGVPAVAVMPAGALTGAENVRRFGHVFGITRVNTRQSDSGSAAVRVARLLLERAPDPARVGQACLPAAP
jgi:hypothetical protein